MGKCFTTQRQEAPQASSWLPAFPGAGHFRSPALEGGAASGSGGPGEAEPIEMPPPVRPSFPSACGEAWGEVLAWLSKPVCRPHLELLLSSVVIQHQLLLLLTADNGFSGWSALSCLKDERRANCGLRHSYRDGPGRYRNVFQPPWPTANSKWAVQSDHPGQVNWRSGPQRPCCGRWVDGDRMLRAAVTAIPAQHCGCSGGGTGRVVGPRLPQATQ